MRVNKLLAGIFLAGAALDASAVPFYTPSVAMNAPPGVTRQVWCGAQNATSANQRVSSTAIFGADGSLVSNSGNVTLPPNTSTWLAGAYGQGLVFCAFNMVNNSKVKAFITVQDTPVGAADPATQYYTVLSLPATQ